MSVNNNFIHSEITDKILKVAIKVHKILGPGFAERFYEKALIHELVKNKIKCVTEEEINIKYDGILLGRQRADLIVEDEVIVELKAVSEINEINIAQVVSYLKASGKKIGLILNFGRNKLEIKRVIV
jgi:GxxExxY protein